jgi:hypothetical protein
MERLELEKLCLLDIDIPEISGPNYCWIKGVSWSEET